MGKWEKSSERSGACEDNKMQVKLIRTETQSEVTGNKHTRGERM